MFLDDLLKLADAQESTISVASTSHIDIIAAGDSYEGAWFYARVDTAFVAGAGEPNGMFSIQTVLSASPMKQFTDRPWILRSL